VAPADTAGWWAGEPVADDVAEGSRCAQAEEAEALQPLLLDPTDGEASRYALLWLAPEGDEDAVRVDVTDGLFDLFDVEAFVYVAPSDLDVAVELRWVADPGGRDRGVVASADEHGPGAMEQLNWAGTALIDDAGTYEIAVRAVQGGSCEVPVWVQVLVGGW
jgi:hypothetical protein